MDGVVLDMGAECLAQRAFRRFRRVGVRDRQDLQLTVLEDVDGRPVGEPVLLCTRFDAEAGEKGAPDRYV